MSFSRSTLQTVLLTAICLAIAGCATPPADPAPAEPEPLGPPIAFEPCVAEAIELDASAWRDYVRDQRELVVLAEPDYEALATLGMTMRLSTIDRRERRMRWLLTHDPARLVVDGDAEAFRMFEWSADDTAALHADDPGVVELTDRAEELGAQYAATPGLSLFVEWYNAELVESDGYREATADLIERERDVRRLLSRCLPIGGAGEAEAADADADADADTDTESDYDGD